MIDKYLFPMLRNKILIRENMIYLSPKLRDRDDVMNDVK